MEADPGLLLCAALRNERSSGDATLKCSDRAVRVQSCVAVALSPVLKAAFGGKSMLAKQACTCVKQKRFARWKTLKVENSMSQKDVVLLGFLTKRTWLN